MHMSSHAAEMTLITSHSLFPLNKRKYQPSPPFILLCVSVEMFLKQTSACKKLAAPDISHLLHVCRWKLNSVTDEAACLK